MNRKAVFLVLLVLVFAGYLLLESGGGGDGARIEESGGARQEDAVGLAAEGVALASGSGVGAMESLAGTEDSREKGRVRLETGLEGVIAGRVVDTSSEPVSGVTILLYPIRELLMEGSRTRPLMQVRSDVEGAFQMEGLELGRYRICVLGKGWEQRGNPIALTVTEPRKLGLILKLRPGGSVSGVVVDTRGQGIVGAWVVASWGRNWFGGVYWPETRTDQQGRFSFDSLPKEEVFIQAWAEGRALGVAEGSPGQAGPIRVQLPESGPFKIIFSLSDPKEQDGNKPSDVIALVYWSPGRWVRPLPTPIRRIVIPVSGEVATLGLREGEYHLDLYSEVVSLEDAWRTQVLTSQDPLARLKIDWAANESIHGRVVSQEGEGISGLVLGAYASMGYRRYLVKSDSDGRFRFPRIFDPKAESQIQITSPGYAFVDGQRRSTSVGCQPGDAESVLTLAAIPLFSGRVLDARGEPVPEAEVWLHHQYSTLRSYGKTRTDEKGRFQLSQKDRYAKQLFLDARRGTQVCSQPLLLENREQQSRSGIVLRLMEGAFISGEVVDEDGARIASA